MTPPTKSDLLAASIEATRDAERGVATCRICTRSLPFEDAIVVSYSGAIVYSMCLPCAEADNQVLIRRGPAGIEILKARNGASLGLGVPGLSLGVVRKRPA
jgi:hypothetical protein